VPRTRLELVLTCVKRILSSSFAQIETNAHKLTLIRSVSYIARVCVALSGLEYTVGQFWDKSSFSPEDEVAVTPVALPDSSTTNSPCEPSAHQSVPQETPVRSDRPVQDQVAWSFQVDRIDRGECMTSDEHGPSVDCLHPESLFNSH